MQVPKNVIEALISILQCKPDADGACMCRFPSSDEDTALLLELEDFVLGLTGSDYERGVELLKTWLEEVP